MESDHTGRALRKALGETFIGRSVLPGDEDYDSARRVWNGTVDKRPALLAYCRSATDVAAAVHAAQEVGTALSVRGGGHQVAGLSVCENGLTIDLSPMHDAILSWDGSVVRAEGGCLLGHVDAANAKAGRIVPAGVVSHTGLGGLALGGGFGWTFRNFGLTCDNIVGAEVVTADGDIVTADEDLLWALRGGGGNFGVVTAFHLKTHPGSDVLFGQAVFVLDDLPRGVEHYVTTMADAPDALSSICITRRVPPIPSVPAHIVGQPAVMIDAVWSGDLAAGDEPIRRLIEDGQPMIGRITRMPYVAVQSMQDDMHPHGRQNYSKSRFLDRVDDTAIKALREAAAKLPGPHSQVEILRLGGAAGRVAKDATAFAHRDSAYILNIVAVWTDLADTERHIAWAREVYSSLDAVGSDAGYVNFIDAEPDRVRSVYPAQTYARLRATKQRVDPRGVFAGNIPIAL
jgi:FAD/FMN-containing dehydrogenase